MSRNRDDGNRLCHSISLQVGQSLVSIPGAGHRQRLVAIGSHQRGKANLAYRRCEKISCLRVILNDERTALPGHDQIVLCGPSNAAGPGNFPLDDALYQRALVLGHPSPIDEIGENRLGERWVTLPPIQYRLLLTLAERAGEVIACQELLRLVWEYDAGETEARVATLEVVLRQIRDLIAAGQEARRAVTMLAQEAPQHHWRSICTSGPARVRWNRYCVPDVKATVLRVDRKNEGAHRSARHGQVVAGTRPGGRTGGPGHLKVMPHEALERLAVLRMLLSADRGPAYLDQSTTFRGPGRGSRPRR